MLWNFVYSFIDHCLYLSAC